MRQVAQQLIDSGVNPKQILYINKEYLAYDFLNNYNDLDALIKSYLELFAPIGRVYVFIDEIQNIANWEKVVNAYAQDFTNDFELFISGSNSKMLSGELATMLSGRYILFEVFPYSYSEYIDIYHLPDDKAAYIAYMQDGGLPELVNLPDDETKQKYVSAVKDSVILKDIVQRYAINNAVLLEDIFVYLVNNVSNFVLVASLVNYFKSKGRKTSYDTVANYIGYLCDAFVMHKTVRYDIKGKETVAGLAKFYSNDHAFQNHLYKGFMHGLGYQLEGLIYLELCRKGYQVYVGALPNIEIDFVAVKDDRLLYVQCAYLLNDELTINREFGALQFINDHYEKIVVSLDDLVLPVKNGIKHLQAWKFKDIL